MDKIIKKKASSFLLCTEFYVLGADFCLYFNVYLGPSDML